MRTRSRLTFSTCTISHATIALPDHYPFLLEAATPRHPKLFSQGA